MGASTNRPCCLIERCSGSPGGGEWGHLPCPGRGTCEASCSCPRTPGGSAAAVVVLGTSPHLPVLCLPTCTGQSGGPRGWLRLAVLRPGKARTKFPRVWCHCSGSCQLRETPVPSERLQGLRMLPQETEKAENKCLLQDQAVNLCSYLGRKTTEGHFPDWEVSSKLHFRDAIIGRVTSFILFSII